MACRFASVICAVLFSCAAASCAAATIAIPVPPISLSAQPPLLGVESSRIFPIHSAEPISVDGLLNHSSQAHEIPLC
jgi:hypothetical protein